MKSPLTLVVIVLAIVAASGWWPGIKVEKPVLGDRVSREVGCPLGYPL